VSVSSNSTIEEYRWKKERIDEGCDRLGLLAFFGLTSFWKSSICLFYYKFGGYPKEFEYGNVRPSTITAEPPVVSILFNNITHWPDYQLYQCAVRLFISQIQFTPCSKLAKEEYQDHSHLLRPFHTLFENL
jgi:hypothetical protein